LPLKDVCITFFLLVKKIKTNRFILPLVLSVDIGHLKLINR